MAKIWAISGNFGVPFAAINRVKYQKAQSQLLLRHQDLKTTQMYVGKISDTEALRWMDVLHGK